MLSYNLLFDSCLETFILGPVTLPWTRYLQLKPCRENVEERAKSRRERKDWRLVLWRVFVRRLKCERFFYKNCLQPTINHGNGSSMIWAGSVRGGTKLKFISVIYDAKVYH